MYNFRNDKIISQFFNSKNNLTVCQNENIIANQEIRNCCDYDFENYKCKSNLAPNIYKCSENCEICFNGNNCIKCFENFAKKENNNSTCYSINELRPYYFKDPNDESNFIKCSDFFNCSTCNDIQCISVNENEDKEKNNKKLMIICIVFGIALFITIVILTIIICYIYKMKNNENNRKKLNIPNGAVTSDNEVINSEERIINEKNKITCTFKTTSGKIEDITFDKNKTISELIKYYFEKMNMNKYYGRKDLFGFLYKANKVPFDSQETVEHFFGEDENKWILVFDKNNLI